MRRADVDGKSQLLRGLDGNKDQSYFLYTLSHEQIAQSLFPVGELEKPQVRKIAEELDLITAKKKIPPASALSASVNSAISLAAICRRSWQNPHRRRRGDRYSSGADVPHPGQRKGLGIGGTKEGSEDPWYVVDKDVENNILIVAGAMTTRA